MHNVKRCVRPIRTNVQIMKLVPPMIKNNDSLRITSTINCAFTVLQDQETQSANAYF